MTDKNIMRLIACYSTVALLSFWTVNLMNRAHAHEVWADGEIVPSWVKSSCCGLSDVHHPKSSQVHATPQGWVVDGYHSVIHYGRELPSQDGDYWIFYKDFPDGSQGPLLCFFAPKQGF